jgi:hypothetical protein
MSRQYFSTFQLILISLFAALIVVAKIALRLPLQLPGHTGIFWMAILIVGVRVVPQRGTASLIGLTSGLLAAFMGLGDFGALDTFLSYLAVGLSTELALVVLPNVENPISAGLVGAIGHTGKFLVKWLIGIITGAPLGFVTLGLAWSLFSYILFGAIGGVLGSLIILSLKKAGFFQYLAEKR